MNALQHYQFQSHNLRIIPDEHGEPWFIAKDVFVILGYANHKDMTKKLCRAQGVSKRYISELSNTYTIIDEGNLYRIIIKSNKPQSEPFESWVCDEVLPSIRKTGAYSSHDLPPAIVSALQVELLKSRPRCREVLALSRAGFSIARQAKMLGFGETTIRKEVGLLKRCGFNLNRPARQQDLLGGVS